MKDVRFEARGLKKTFNRRSIFSNISFSLKAGESLAITGKNGSGKSTLIKIAAGLLSSTAGEIELSIDGETVESEDRHDYLGFVAPYLQLYEEFTAVEHLDLLRRMRNMQSGLSDGMELLKRVNLYPWRSQQIRTYSSGMKQRLKYVCALLHRPPILMLDEPTSNLDAEGIAIVYEVMKEQVCAGILLVATNDAEDVQYCQQSLDLNAFLNTRVGAMK